MKFVIKVIALFLVCLTSKQFCSSSTTTTASTPQRAKVIFFNVGQGNCTLIVEPGRPGILIDAGSSKFPGDESIDSRKRKQSTAKEIIDIIASEVQSQRLQIIISHPDKDHGNLIGNIISGLPNFTFNQPIVGGLKSDYHNKASVLSDTIKKLVRLNWIDAASFNNIQALQNIIQRSNPNIHVLASNPYADDNNKSIILKYSMPESNKSFIIGGDAGKDIIYPIREQLNCDILNSFHHGAETDDSNSTDIWNNASPVTGIFSASNYLKYFHPRASAIINAASVVGKMDNCYFPVSYYSTDRKKIDITREPDNGMIRTFFKRADSYYEGATNLSLLNTFDCGSIMVEDVDKGEDAIRFITFSVNYPSLQALIAGQINNGLSTIAEIDLSDSGLAVTLISLPQLPDILHSLNVVRNRLTADQIHEILSRIPSISRASNSRSWPNWRAAGSEINYIFADYSSDADETNEELDVNATAPFGPSADVKFAGNHQIPGRFRFALTNAIYYKDNPGRMMPMNPPLALPR